MTFLRPRFPAEAVRVYNANPEALPMAGGTDIMVSWNAGLLNGKTIIDLSRIAEWARIKKDEDGLLIGSTATHTAIRTHAAVQKDFPLLAAAAGEVGAIQNQNRGTLGGNLANASPAGDTFPPLAVYDATIRTVSPHGRWGIPISDFFAGVKKTHLKRAELIETIEIPFLKTPPTRQVFRKVGTRAAQAISKTVAAGLLWLNRGKVSEIRFAFGSMAPTVRRLKTVEDFLLGEKLTPSTVRKACELLKEDVSPIDDIRSTRAYRLHVSQNLLRDFLS